jgi:acyl-CoA thioester hydrolase
LDKILEKELKKYKHKYRLRVRNFEVDSQGIVHNAIYLEYCEVGRAEYVRNMGFHLLISGLLDNGLKINVKRNEINYEAPALLDDLVDVYSRVSYIKNSSFCFEHLIINSRTGVLCSTQKSVQVNLNIQTGRPERLPDEIRKLISAFEGNDLVFLN